MATVTLKGGSGLGTKNRLRLFVYLVKGRHAGTKVYRSSTRCDVRAGGHGIPGSHSTRAKHFFSSSLDLDIYYT